MKIQCLICNREVDEEFIDEHYEQEHSDELKKIDDNNLKRLKEMGFPLR